MCFTSCQNRGYYSYRGQERGSPCRPQSRGDTCASPPARIEVIIVTGAKREAPLVGLRVEGTHVFHLLQVIVVTEARGRV
jgi:hypothetical protein